MSFRRLATTLLVLGPGLGLGTSNEARADLRDLQLYQLGNPASDVYANARFAAMVNELGVAIGSWNLEPPETTGFSGFNFAAEYPVAFINDSGKINGQHYWPFEGAPQGILQMPGVHIRKGFPFSFEAGSKVNYIVQSNMVAATVEAKWALNEGFIYFPDLGVRGFGTQLIGARDFNLTTAGFDIGIGKQLALLGMFTLTPYAGWNSIWVAGGSNVIDFDPSKSEPDQFKDGASGTSTTNVFDQVNLNQNRHDRFYVGLRFISYIVEVGAEFSATNVKTTADVGTSTAPKSEQVSNYTVYTWAAKIGLDF